ncbi:MAG: GFA family protein [Hyphomicrobiaceae bacterium]|nr:GFA family protein [Hyphomicrobiaceae bacterium]
MADDAERVLTGGCLCGGLRYRATGAPAYAGLCHCEDCQKSSGSAFAPFMGYPLARFSFSGPASHYDHRLKDGRTSRRNFCPTCGSTVFGGGEDEEVTIYAGSLDDPALFVPRMQIFCSNRREWAHIVPGSLREFDEM